MRLRNLSALEGQGCYFEYIEAINKLRSNYPWSNKTYDASNTQNVYLICCNKQCVGFIDCIYHDTDFARSKPVYIYLSEMHIAPSMQNKGIGKAVLNHLLTKGVDVAMVIANKNTNMLTLLSKFNNEHKDITEHTRTIILKALV